MVLACVHRNESGTTLLLRAAGRSALVDGVAVTVIAAMTAAGLLLLSGVVIPQSQGAYRTLNAQMQQDSLAAITLPIGSPIAVGAGVMLTVGAHTADGLFHDIEVVDYSARDETTIITCHARHALALPPDGAAILTLENGRLQRIDPTGRTDPAEFHQHRPRCRFTNAPHAKKQPTPPSIPAAAWTCLRIEQTQQLPKN